jgi:cytochrome c-type biogenesis protein
MMDLAFLTASSGILAALTPCAIPAYPVMLNILSRDGKSRAATSIGFALGITSSFTLFYVAIAYSLKVIGIAFFETLTFLYAISYFLAGLMCYAFVINSLRGGGFPGLRVDIGPKIREGPVGAFIAGSLFAVVISPCGTPFILSGIVPILLSKATMIEGLALMMLFSAGISLPMLSLGLLSGHIMGDKIRVPPQKIEQFSMLFLIIAGAYLLYMGYLSLQPGY